MTKTEVLEAGDQLVSRVVVGDLRDDDPGYQLVQLCWRGYPLDRLRPLFSSSDENGIRVAASILAELGRDARPLLDVVRPLLHHPWFGVRHHAVETVLLCATEADAELVSEAIELVMDPQPFVRSTVVMFLVRGAKEVVRAGSEWLSRKSAGQEIADVLLKSGTNEDWVRVAAAANEDLAMRLAALARLIGNTTEDGSSSLRQVAANLPSTDEVAILALKEVSERERDAEKRRAREARRRNKA